MGVSSFSRTNWVVVTENHVGTEGSHAPDSRFAPECWANRKKPNYLLSADDPAIVWSLENRGTRFQLARSDCCFGLVSSERLYSLFMLRLVLARPGLRPRRANEKVGRARGFLVRLGCQRSAAATEVRSR